MSKIQILSDDIVNKIAAGEVVERPASALKEMLDNAMDAGSTWIQVALEKGGIQSLIVTDDGEGMEDEDARLALRRHATSKIRTIDDLFEVQTMGFRGEALAAIAAVSRLSLSTVRKGQGSGIKLVSGQEGGGIQELPWSGPAGTTVAVESLFYNVPARHKFLKTPAVEYGFCLDLIHAVALSQPHVGLSLRHQGKEQFRAVPIAPGEIPANPESGHLKGEGPLRERAQLILGKDASQLIYVTKVGRFGTFEGLISPPGLNRGTAKGTFAFVNNRWVKDKVIRQAMMRAYHSHLAVGKFPWAVIHLTIDPTLIDVNVHPAKTEVRFQYPNEVHNLIVDTIRESLRTGGWAERDTGAGLSSHVPGPSMTPFSSAAQVSATAPSASSMPSAPAAFTDSSPPTGRPFLPERPRVGGSALGGGGGVPTITRQVFAPMQPAEVDGPQAGTRGAESGSGFKGFFEQYSAKTPFSPSRPSAEFRDAAPEPLLPKAFSQGSLFNLEPDLRPKAGPSDLPDGRRPAIDKPSSTDTESAPVPPWDQLEYVGAFAQCYLIFRSAESLLLVDQHAFHERILYEKLVSNDRLLYQSQRLLVPEGIEMAPSEVQLLMGFHPQLFARGFDFAPAGPTTLEILAVPTMLVGRDLAELFGDLARDDANHFLDQSPLSNGQLSHHVLSKLACHSAVRAGEDLMPGELRRLLAEAREVDFYHNCPHGRRVFKWWGKSQVAQWFDR